LGAPRRTSREGKVCCWALLELARKAKVNPIRLGRLCDEMGIRIEAPIPMYRDWRPRRACQLGCFR